MLRCPEDPIDVSQAESARIDIGALCHVWTSDPSQVADISRTMDLFDAVAYGDLTASRDDALTARSTDAALHEAKPVLPPRSARGSRGDDGTPPPPTQPGSGSGETEPDSIWLSGVRP